MIDDITAITQEIPYYGLTTLAGLAFALDQFAQKSGFHSFAEWAASHFLAGSSLSGYVKAVDELEPLETPAPGPMPATFGYEVCLLVTKQRDAF
ncbi:hypothetical protein BJF93_11390 [Xaviernesmea oryzae]|uniref:Uncharacterized protein n=1 Tax=Xaviernesmea oryzae TaxID=464029 RepID=A0A1Q9AW71_9HYPH|nr:hypothetical protein [Xaviernesmea oryzae]OLP59664.1 hypothetical protein BJF93_11390 [Xaviernesmea oryzae]